MPVLTRADAAKELLARRKARSRLQDFICYINPEYIVSDFSETVCDELDRFLLDMQNGLRPILILSAPPQHGKSDIVSRYLPAYAFGKYPELRAAGLSYGKDLATDMNRDVQRIMLSDDYANVFPKSTLNSRRVVTMDVEAKRNSDMFEIVDHRGSYVSQGVGGPLTGKKVDLGIIDDPIKNAKEALSETTKSSVWNWYVSTFLTRLSKNSGQIIMATRWAVDDLSGRIEENNKNARVLTFPAINENGEALIPDLHPVEKLLETKSTMTDYFWTAMYQQTPIIAGGGMFPVDRFSVIESQPAKADVLASVRMWDKAGTDGGGARTAGVLMHRLKDGRYVVADVVKGQWSAIDRERRIKQCAEIDGRNVQIVIEQEPGSGGKESAESTIRNLAGWKVSADRVTGSKELRADPYAAQVQGGNVLIVRGEWNRQFMDEHDAFPNGKFKDQVDAAAGAFNKLASINANVSSWL